MMVENIALMSYDPLFLGEKKRESPIIKFVLLSFDPVISIICLIDDT